MSIITTREVRSSVAPTGCGSSSGTRNTPPTISILKQAHQRATKALARVASRNRSIGHRSAQQCARRCHYPPRHAAVLVEPTLDPVEPVTQAVRWDADPDAHGEASFSLGDHEVGASSHRVFRFCSGKASHILPGESSLLEQTIKPPVEVDKAVGRGFQGNDEILMVRAVRGRLAARRYRAHRPSHDPIAPLDGVIVESAHNLLCGL